MVERGRGCADEQLLAGTRSLAAEREFRAISIVHEQLRLPVKHHFRGRCRRGTGCSSL